MVKSCLLIACEKSMDIFKRQSTRECYQSYEEDVDDTQDMNDFSLAVFFFASPQLSLSKGLWITSRVASSFQPEVHKTSLAYLALLAIAKVLLTNIYL